MPDGVRSLRNLRSLDGDFIRLTNLTPERRAQFLVWEISSGLSAITNNVDDSFPISSTIIRKLKILRPIGVATGLLAVKVIAHQSGESFLVFSHPRN